MRNLYLIPTDKPSRLVYLTKKGKEVFKDLRLFDRLMPNILDSENQHIYITSDEEIQEDNWVFECSLNWVFKSHKHGLPNYNPNKKKIILTTDPDLIKDGVQQISDEFLEWFVENPSCKSVEIDTYSKKIGVETDANGYREMDVFGKDYKIIIPQEEPKEDWIYNNPQCKQIESCSKSLSKKCICPQKEFKQNTKDEVDLLVNELINKFTNWSGSYVYRDKLIEIYEQNKKK